MPEAGGTAGLMAMLRLASPALPIGGFSYSQGLETAIERGWVRNGADLVRWLDELLALNIGRFEAPLVFQLCNAVADGRHQEAQRLHALYLSSRETAELRAESLQMGYSLLQLLGPTATATGTDPSGTHPSGADPDGCALPYAWALAAVAFGLTPQQALTAYLWAWLENQVMAALKAVPLGQQAGQRAIAALTPRLAAVCDQAAGLPEEQWSNFAPGFALASSWHETQYSRLFRS